MEIREIKDDIYYIGVVDHDLKVFDIIMETKFGTSYNSYLIKDGDFVVLVDTVKAKFQDEYLENLNKLGISIDDINYIVVNHTEPDHAGTLEYLLSNNPKIKVCASMVALNNLKNIMNMSFDGIPVKTGSILELETKHIEFHTMPNLHWPDTIYSHLVEDNVLFTCDSFGSHYAYDDIFISNLEEKYMSDFDQALRDYFDPIFSPFKKFMIKGINKTEEINPDVICAGHGPVLDSKIEHVLDLYKEWSHEGEVHPHIKKDIMIIVTSAYGYTTEMAMELKHVLSENNNVDIYELDVANFPKLRDSIIKKLSSIDCLLVGSSTINNDAIPFIYDILSNLNPVVHKQLYASVFGSYGWSGEGVKNVDARLIQLTLKRLKSFMFKFKASKKELMEIRNYAKYIDGAINNNLDLEYYTDVERILL